MNPTDLLGAMKRTVGQLAAFNDIAKALTSTLALSEVLDLIGEKGSQLLGAERWSLLLIGDDGMLHFEVVRGPGSDTLRGEVLLTGEGIAGTVFTSGKARLVADARTDPDFADRFDQLTNVRTLSVLAVPLTARGYTLGVLELVGEGAEFNDDDLRAASTMADFAAIAIDNARNFEKAQALTLTDEHTGLYNARHLRAQLEREVARCARFARPLSLLFIDLDSFKQVNDAHGHLAGSSLLRLTGQRLMDNVRSVDLVFRYGGDEFAVMLVETGHEGAEHVAERVVHAFREATFDVGGKEPVQLTVSVGVATFPDNGTGARSLLDAADKAMYRAKHEGRDRWARGA